jgi:hypothetical protein
MRIVALVSFVLLALSGFCACSKPSPPTLTPLRASVTGVDALGVRLDLELSAANPNTVDLSARSVTAHVVVDRKLDLGTVTLPDAVTLPAGKSTKLSVPVSVAWTDLGALAQLAASSAAVPFTVDGTVEMGGDLLHVAVPFHIDGSVSHDELVHAALGSLPSLGPR